MNIPKIVLTGGPCAGKSSAQTFLAEKLRGIGYYPIFIPEVPTLLMGAGVTPIGGIFSTRVFQEQVIDLMLRLDDEFTRAAGRLNHPKPILICDRGIMDAKAYMPEEMFWDVTRSRGLDLANMRDGRYLGVFHLRTAALGAEEFYTLANNAVRRETLEEAREVDERTLQSWVGHPHVAVIDNEGKNFEQKLHHLWAKICRVLGVPVPLEIERKFLVKPVPLSFVEEREASEIEQCYIRPRTKDAAELRVRKRGQYGAYTYYETMKRELRPSVRVETERFITATEYATLLEFQEPSTRVIRKKRHCFVYKNQYFELDIFTEPKEHSGLHLLEIELTEENDKVELPPWIEVIEEVTGRPEFSNRALASK